MKNEKSIAELKKMVDEHLNKITELRKKLDQEEEELKKCTDKIRSHQPEYIVDLYFPPVAILL